MSSPVWSLSRRTRGRFAAFPEEVRAFLLRPERSPLILERSPLEMEPSPPESERSPPEWESLQLEWERFPLKLRSSSFGWESLQPEWGRLRDLRRTSGSECEGLQLGWERLPSECGPLPLEWGRLLIRFERLARECERLPRGWRRRRAVHGCAADLIGGDQDLVRPRRRSAKRVDFCPVFVLGFSLSGSTQHPWSGMGPSRGSQTPCGGPGGS
jgi:hypothetical protein